jgi:hypothetical protein
VRSLGAAVAGLLGRPQRIADAEGLSGFMDRRAAFLAQKCVVEFCRVRAGVYWQKLFSEHEFQEALARSRWRSYPPAYAMTAEMVEGTLRDAAGDRQRRLPGVLGSMAARTFQAYPVPAGMDEDFWAKALELVESRLAATQTGAPRPVRAIPEPTARLVFSALPIHKDIVTHDYDYIFNNLRMNLLRAHEDLLKQGDLPAIAEDLLGRG